MRVRKGGAWVALTALIAAILAGGGAGGGGTPTPTPTPTPTATPTATPTVTSVSCDRNAANASELTTQVSAATTGQTVCLTSSASYGAWAGTNKQITITPSDSASPTMTLNLASGDANFTIDGKRDTWNDTTGLHINGGTIGSGVQNVTLRDFWSTGAGRLWTFSQPPNTNFVIDHAHFYNVQSGEAIIYIDHNAVEPASTGITIRDSLFRNSSADGIKLAGDNATTILDNKFLISHECLPSCSGNHTDAIQFYSGTGSLVRGNWVDDCDQAISGFDSMGSATITHNLVTDCDAHYFTAMWDRPASTIEWNTIGDSDGVIICGNKSQYSASNQASLTRIRNNVARGISLTGGGATCVPSSNTNNLVTSGATAGNINGTPTWAGGATPTTYAGYCLAGGSPGITGASDGGQVGIGGGGNTNCTVYGPPTGEGY